MIAFLAETAITMPAIPLNRQSRTLSVSSWRNRRIREAPMAARTALRKNLLSDAENGYRMGRHGSMGQFGAGEPIDITPLR